jgi:DnaJ-class molecular chaperone
MDLEDFIDFAEEARMRRQPLQPCPECKGSGKSKQGPRCGPCEGIGQMTRMQANNYYGEGGVLDAEEDQAAEERAAEEQDRLDREEYGP